MGPVTTTELLTACRRSGVTLTSHGVRVRVIARTGVVTPELRGALSARKRELVQVVWRLEGMRRHRKPVPTARNAKEAPGGPGRCFSCGDKHEHPEAYGRCTWCWIAAEAFYTEQGSVQVGRSEEIPDPKPHRRQRDD